MSIVFQNMSKIIRGYRQEDNFTYTIIENPLGAPGSTSTSAVYDANITSTVSTGVTNNFGIFVSKSLSNLGNPVFTSITPSIASVDSSGNVSRVLDGNATIAINTAGIEQRYSRTMALSGSVTVLGVQAYLTNSVGASVSSFVDTLISGKTAQGNTSGLGGIQNLMSTNNYNLSGSNTITATRNSGFFASSLDFSGIGIANDNSSFNTHPPLLVTSRHIMGANHYQVAGGLIGSKVAFMRIDGTIQTETILSTWSDPESDDHWIGLLSNPITGCTPLKIMPSGWKNYFKSLDTLVGNSPGSIPVLCKVTHKPDGTTDDRVSILELTSVQSDKKDFIVVSKPSVVSRQSWYSPIIGGDSGGAIMIPINGSLVLLAAFFTSSGGYSVEKDSTEEETAMNTLAAAQGDNTVYSFSRADLSGFTSY